MLATISFKNWSLAASGPAVVKLLKAFLTEVGAYGSIKFRPDRDFAGSVIEV
jgi:hypothetical protein